MNKVYLSRDIIAVVGVAIVSALIFGRVVNHDFFHFDDAIHVYGNPLLNPVSESHLRQIWQAPYEALYIPLSYTLFAILSLVARTNRWLPELTDTGAMLNPHLFHGASLVLHSVNTGLVYLLLSKTVKQRLPAIAGTLFWGLHPLQVESVAWISELRGLLSAQFSLLALLAYPFGAHSKSTNRQYFQLALAISLGICAMLSKPSAITTPIAAAIIDVALYKSQLRPVLTRFGLWMACLLPLALITTNVQSGGLSGPLYEPPMFLRPIIGLDALGFYISKLAPFASMCTDYGRTPFITLHSATTFWDCGLSILLLIAIVFTISRNQVLLASGLLFITALLPVSGLVPFNFQYFSTVSDRYLYLALLGPALAIAEVIKQRPNPIVKISIACLIASCAVATWIQIGYWQNTETYAKHIIDINPKSLAAEKLLGDIEVSRGDYPKALQYYELEINNGPDDYRGYSDSGRVYLATGHADLALPLLQKAAAMKPDLFQNHMNLGDGYFATGQIAKAAEEYRQAVNVAPKIGEGYYGLARVAHANRDDSAAIAWLEKAIQVNPEYHNSYDLLGSILTQQGREKEALNIFVQETQYNPSSPVPFYSAGLILSRQRQIGQAAQYFQQAIALLPTYAPAHVAYGAILGQRGNIAGAISEFQSALIADPSNQAARRNLDLALRMQRVNH